LVREHTSLVIGRLSMSLVRIGIEEKAKLVAEVDLSDLLSNGHYHDVHYHDKQVIEYDGYVWDITINDDGDWETEIYKVRS